MDFKQTIKDGYEKNDYIKTFRSRGVTDFERTIFDRMISSSPGKEVLDLGCGNGYPYDRYFMDKGFSLTGVDFSERFINLWSYFDYKTYIQMLRTIGFRLVYTDNDTKYGGTENIDWSIFEK